MVLICSFTLPKPKFNETPGFAKIFPVDLRRTEGQDMVGFELAIVCFVFKFVK